jgi:hypothetical protein
MLVSSLMCQDVTCHQVVVEALVGCPTSCWLMHENVANSKALILPYTIHMLQVGSSSGYCGKCVWICAFHQVKPLILKQARQLQATTTHFN